MRRWNWWFAGSLVVAGLGNVTLTLALLSLLPAAPALIAAFYATTVWDLLCVQGATRLETWLWWRRWERQMSRELAALESQVRSHLTCRAHQVNQVMGNRKGGGA